MNQNECKKIINLIERGNIEELLAWAKQQKTQLEVKAAKALHGDNFKKGIKTMLKYTALAAKGNPMFGKAHISNGLQTFTNNHFILSLNKKYELSDMDFYEPSLGKTLDNFFKVFKKDNNYVETPINIDLVNSNVLENMVCISRDDSKIFLNQNYVKMVVYILGEDLQVFCKDTGSAVLFKSKIGSCFLLPIRPKNINNDLIVPINN